MKDCLDDVDFYIADNSDNSQTYKILQPFIEAHPITYVKNGTNLGCVGSMYRLSSIANSEYIWFLGDDDHYSVGLIKKVVTILKRTSTGLVFINHGAFSHDRILSTQVYSKNKYYQQNNTIQSLYDLFKEVQLELLLISCLVIKKQYFDESKLLFDSAISATPFGIALYAMRQEGVYITDFIGLHNNWGDSAWIDIMPKVYSEEIIQLFNLFIYELKDEEFTLLRTLYIEQNRFANAVKIYCHHDPVEVENFLIKYHITEDFPLSRIFNFS